MKIAVARRQAVKALALLFATFATGQFAFSAEDKMQKAEEVNPPEDLMREHGVLRRVLLIYRNLLQKLDTGAEIQWGSVGESAAIIRTFVEDYHEKLEEQYVFPALRQAGKLVDTVQILIQQHQAGRRLTDTITEIVKRKGTEPADRKRLYTAIDQFIRMYEPHAAREDTILFPQLHIVWKGKKFEEMGDVFEREEDRLFGEGGFEKMVDRVAKIEKDLGIYDLNRFTP